MNEREEPEASLEVSSIVAGPGPRLGLPFVVLNVGNQRAQLTPEEARAHALLILSAADAAESDAFIVMWLETRLNADPVVVGAVLNEFRQFRHSQVMIDEDPDQ